MAGRTLFDKIWDAHVVRDLGDGWALLHIDRHLLHDLSGSASLADMAEQGLAVHDPELDTHRLRRPRWCGPVAAALARAALMTAPPAVHG